ncbi:MAG: hypothetical protein CMJ76_08090, partial [Planctomycetaceae bacterium]|nr:hypothetical protein [Planctomycetaceae bacterium]
MAINHTHNEILRLNSLDSSYDRRRAIEAISSNDPFTVKIIVEKIERSYGYIREDGFRDGKAIIGKLDGSDQELKLVFPQKMNEQVDSWSAGQTVIVNASFHEFDSAYKRYQMLVRNLPDDIEPKTSNIQPLPQPNEKTISNQDQTPSAETQSAIQDVEAVTETNETTNKGTPVITDSFSSDQNSSKVQNTNPEPEPEPEP